MARRIDVKEENSPALADVLKTMKSILPTSCSVDPDALDLVKKCVSRFISSVSSEAISRSVHNGSNALTSDDIVGALDTIGYEDYKLPIELYLAKFSSHAVMKRPPEVVKAARKVKHVNSSSMVPKVAPKSKPNAVPQQAIQSQVGSSSSSSSSSAAVATPAVQTVVLPASLTAPNRTMAQKMEDAIMFAIKNPNISIKRLCEVVGIPRHQFKEALQVHLNGVRSQQTVTTVSTVKIPDTTTSSQTPAPAAPVASSGASASSTPVDATTVGSKATDSR